MLQDIRDRTQKWVIYLILSLVCIAFMLFGIQYYIQVQRSAPTIRATVDGYKISDEDLDIAFRRLQRKMQMQYGEKTYTSQMSEQLKTQALQQLIHTHVLTQATKQLGFAVSEQQLQTTLMQNPMFQEEGKFSVSRFNEFLNIFNYTPKTFMQDLRNQIRWTQLRSGIVESAFVSDEDFHHFIALLLQKRRFRFVKLTPNTQTIKTPITEKDIQNYFETHKEHFRIPEQISINYILLSQPTLFKQQTVSDKELHTFYETHKANYRTPQKWKVAHILLRVPEDADEKQTRFTKEKANNILKLAKKGEDFGKLAKQYSEDIISAKRDGVLDWITPGTMNKPFEKAVVELKKPGALTNVIRTPYGFEIIKLIDYQPIRQLSLKEVKPTLETRIKNEKAQKAFTQLSEELGTLAFEQPDNLHEAASTLKLPIQTSPLFSKTHVTKDPILSNPAVITAAFSDDVLSQGYNSQLIPLENNQVIVLRQHQHVPSKIPTINSVRSKIVSRIKQEKQIQQVKKLVDTLQDALNKKQVTNALLTQYKLKWQQANLVQRDSQAYPPKLIEALFKLPYHAGHPEKSSTFLTLPDGTVYLLEVQMIVPGDIKKLTEQEIKHYKKHMQQNVGQWDYQQYFKYLQNNANIKISPTS